MKKLLASAALAAALQMTCSGLASAQDMYLGEVRQFGYNWCPVNWLQASGQILPIQQYSALFSLYGTSFGGNGTTTFALPNLNGRTPYGWGPPGQAFGAVYGVSAVTLTVGNLPSHTHQYFASTAAPTVNTVANGYSATFNAGDKVYAPAGSPANAPMSQTSIGFTGSNIPVNVQSPALAMNWCVATSGVYPSRP
jgi:microcystin-dependent protein